MDLHKHNIIEFNNKRLNKEKELTKKIYYLKNNYPSIKKALDEINNYGIKACSENIKKEDFDKKNKELNENLQKELSKLGFDKNYLEIKYDCEKCSDTGYINGHMCSCLREYLYKTKTTHPLLMRDGNFDIFDENLFSEKNFKNNISPKENILKNKQQALKFINDFEDNNNIGLLMSGTVGSGKTFLAAATGKVLLKKGYDVICLTAKEFEDTIKNFSNPSLEDKKIDILNTDLLILDDLGIETQSEYVNNELLKLFDYRITYNKKMIITTNLTLNEIRDKYKSRIYSRIVSNFKYLKFFGPDLRIAKKINKNK